MAGIDAIILPVNLAYGVVAAAEERRGVEVWSGAALG